MFGDTVTNYDQFATGNYGYIIAVDLSLIYAKEISGIQLLDDANSHMATLITSGPISLDTLMNYLYDIDCPDFAYSVNSDVFYLFCKDGVYDYTTTTRFTLHGKRYAKPIISLTDNLDIRESELELFINYVLKQASLYSNKRIDPEIDRNIKYLETKLKAEQ